jgi:hypothetical protein
MQDFAQICSCPPHPTENESVAGALSLLNWDSFHEFNSRQLSKQAM